MTDRAALTRVIDEMRREGAALGPPTDMVALTRLDRHMAELSYPPAPVGYKTLLSIADGLVFDGTTLHGTRDQAIDVEGMEVTIPAITTFLGERSAAGWSAGNTLPIGRSETDLIHADPNTGEIIACDPYSGDEYERWADIAAYLTAML